jgi:hypothetical protein
MGSEPAGGSEVLVSFERPVALDDAEEVALEDYARVVARAREAKAVRGPGPTGPVTAVRLGAVSGPPTPQMRTDIEDFARDLAERGGRTGLGWT